MTSLIGISGGSASGKTSIAKMIASHKDLIGNVIVIRQDDYYLDRSNLSIEDRKLVNYDHPDAFDNELMYEQLCQLKQGYSINMPVYDFSTHTRKAVAKEISPYKVIIIEGILVFGIKKIRDLFDIKIFVDTPSDIRILRRIKRDIAERGRTIDSIETQYIESVKPMHDMFVEPTRLYADVIIPEGSHNEVGVSMIINSLIQMCKVY